MLVAELEDVAGGNSISRLYSINNIGAVAGSLVCGFILIRLFGASASAGIAAAIAIMTGIAAFFAKETTSAKAAHTEESCVIENDIRPERSTLVRKTIAVLFVLSGFTSLSYELLYNRTITYFVGNNTYSFTILVSVFILGLAVGSYIFALAIKKKIRVSELIMLFAFSQLLLAFYHIIMPGWTASLNGMLMNLRFSLGYDSLAALYLVKGSGAALTIFIPAVIFGFIYPVVFRIYFPTPKKISPDKAGFLSAINTFGTAVGPLVTIFVIVALAGVSGAMRVNAVTNLILGTAAIVLYFHAVEISSRALKAGQVIAVLIVAVMACTVSPENTLGRKAALASASDTLIFYKEGVFGTVSVSKKESGVKEIRINGVGEVPTDHDSMRTFRMLAHIPFTIIDEPQSVLSIAFGGGITFGSIAQHNLASTTCVEICRDVLDAAPLYEVENHGVYENRNVRIVIMDGRKYLSGTPQLFDIITSDSTHPASYDSWILYTKEFYRSCKTHLNSNGVFAQWVPLHDLSVTDFKTVLKTFSSQFTHAALYLTNSYTVIIGSDSPIEPKAAAFAKITRDAVIANELADVNIRSIDDIQRYLVMKDDELRLYAADGVVADDDHTPLQFTESRSFSRNTISDNMKSFRDFILARHPEGIDVDLPRYLDCAAMFEDGNLENLAATVAKVKNPDAELVYIAQKGADARKAELLGMDNISKILAEESTGKALAMIDNLIAAYPKEGLPYSVKGYLVFSREKDIPQAEKLYDTAVRLSPAHSVVLGNAAKFYFTAEIYEKALSTLQASDRTTPDNEGIIYRIAVTLIKMNRNAEASKVISAYRNKSGNASFAEDLNGMM